MEQPEKRSLRARIADYYRERILSGELPPGSKLESTLELSQRFETAVGNVQKALSQLVAEGLISRRPNSGTFVNVRKTDLQTVGLCFAEEGYYANAFVRELANQLKLRLRELGLEGRLLLTPGGLFEREQLQRLFRYNQLQGVITSGISPEEYEQLRKLQLPFAVLTGGRYANGVEVNNTSIMNCYFEAVRETGCRKVGLVSVSHGPPFLPSDRFGKPYRIYRGFVEHIRRRALETRESWCCFGRRGQDFPTTAEAEFFAYEAVKRIFSQPERPEVLLVYPDPCNYGVLLALEQLRLRVPEEVKLVLYRNREIRQICPVPAQRVTVSVAELAAALVRQLLRGFHGQACAPLQVDCRLER